MLQLAAPNRRQRVWTRIFKFLTRTIRSPAVTPLARYFRTAVRLGNDGVARCGI